APAGVPVAAEADRPGRVPHLGLGDRAQRADRRRPPRRPAEAVRADGRHAADGGAGGGGGAPRVGGGGGGAGGGCAGRGVPAGGGGGWGGWGGSPGWRWRCGTWWVRTTTRSASSWG